jgi:hypothetical protein
LLSDISLKWMIDEARTAGLQIEPHLNQSLKPRSTAGLHVSRRSFYRIKKKFYRPIDHGKSEVLLHRSVKERWDADADYRPKNLAEYVEFGWPAQLV